MYPPTVPSKSPRRCSLRRPVSVRGGSRDRETGTRDLNTAIATLHCASMLCRHCCCCCCCVAAELLLLLSLPSLSLLPRLRCAEATAAASHLHPAACSVSAGHASCSGRAVTMYALPPFVKPCACPCWSPRFARLSNIEMDERGGVGVVSAAVRPGTPAEGAHRPAQHAGVCHVMCESMKRVMVRCVECAMACSLSAVGSVDLGAVPLRSERVLSAAMRLSRPLESRTTRAWLAEGDCIVLYNV